MQVNELRDTVAKIRGNVEKIIIGKTNELDIVLAAMIAGGHVLLEDVPGTGKTMLAKALARSIDMSYSRIQFTPDLLPSDVIGINFYNPQRNDFVLKKGAVFTNVLLADEINRATPRTQSALLESMEEKQVTIDGTTYPLEPPYFVIATQNPVETQGTYPLPEAQLDRFLVKLSLGYPTSGETVTVLKNVAGRNPLEDITPVCTRAVLRQIQECAASVYADDELLGYIVELAERTRVHDYVSLGVSVRGSISLLNICRAFAAMRGREFVIPDDVQILAPYVFTHRMICKGGQRNQNLAVIKEILEKVKPPVEKWYGGL